MIAIAPVFMFLEGSMLGAPAYLMKPMFDRVFVAGGSSMLFDVGGVVISIFLLRAVSRVAQKLLLSHVAMRFATTVRLNPLSQMTQQDGTFHQEYRPGYLIQYV